MQIQQRCCHKSASRSMSRQSSDPKTQLDWRLEVVLRDGSLTTDRSASRNVEEAIKVLYMLDIDGSSKKFSERWDETKSPVENAKLLIAAISVCFEEKPKEKTEEAEGLVIEGGAAAVRERLEARLASEVGKARPAVTPYAARLKQLEDLYEATKDSSLADLPISVHSGLAPPVVGARCRIQATGRWCKIVELKGTNRLVVELDENSDDDGDAFEQVTTFMNRVTDFSPARLPADTWVARFKEANCPLSVSKKPQGKKWSDFAKASAKAALDAHKATADKDSDAARDADDKASTDLGRSYYCAVVDETEALFLERLGDFKGDRDAIKEWLAPCAAKAALKSFARAKSRGQKSVLAGGPAKAEKKRKWVERRRKKWKEQRRPTGDERAPRNLYYQYVYQLFLAGNLTPACPWESLTGLKKDPENPPSFTGE